jgi:hypothetical protein
MTRRSIATVLGSLIVALLIVVNATVASAEEMTDGGGGGSITSAGDSSGRDAPEHCAETAALADAARFATGTRAQPVNVLGGSGIGQEQFAAIEGEPDAVLLVAAPTAEAAHIRSGYAPEHYEQMLARQPTD